MGLDLEGCHERCPYGSISGTARFMGEFQNLNIEDIVDYDFTRNSRYINTIILAIPKYISLPTGRQEFSSFDGHMDYFNRFRKMCLLDISKERYLPTEFIFGYQLVDRQTGEIKFWQNDRCFSQLTKEDQDEIMQGFAKRIEAVFDDCKTNHNAASIKEVFEIMTNRHMSLLDDYFNDI